MARVMEQAEARFGRIEGLVNSAGVAPLNSALLSSLLLFTVGLKLKLGDLWRLRTSVLISRC